MASEISCERGVNDKLQAKLTKVEFLYLLYWSFDFLSFFNL